MQRKFFLFQFYAGLSFWMALDTRDGAQLQRILVSVLRPTPCSRFEPVHEFSTSLMLKIHAPDGFQGFGGLARLPRAQALDPVAKSFGW